MSGFNDLKVGIIVLIHNGFGYNSEFANNGVFFNFHSALGGFFCIKILEKIY